MRRPPLPGAACGLESYLMRSVGGDQQARIIGAPSVDFVVGYNLIFRLLQFHHPAEFVGLGRFALANDFCRWLEQAQANDANQVTPFGLAVLCQPADSELRPTSSNFAPGRWTAPQK